MKRSLLALTLLAALPCAASAAEGLSYNYVEGGYIATDSDGGYIATDSDSDGADADGWGLSGSGAISENFHVFGSYSVQKNEFKILEVFPSEPGGPGPFVVKEELDVDQWRVGLGYNYAIASNTDLLARVAYVNYGFDFGQFGVDHTEGYSAEVGVRSALTPRFEGHALAGYEDVDGFDGDLYGRLGAQVKINQNWGVSGDVKFADNDTQWFVGPRLTF